MSHIRKGYLPWIYVNYYTLWSAIGRIFGNPIKIEYSDSEISAKGSTLILFNLAGHFRIEMTEIGGDSAKCPHIRYLLVIAAKSGRRVRVKAVFSKV